MEGGAAERQSTFEEPKKVRNSITEIQSELGVKGTSSIHPFSEREQHAVPKTNINASSCHNVIF